MRVLVTGGRHYHFKDAVFIVLDSISVRRGIECVIHGGATGADAMAAAWATSRRVPAVACPANWKMDGKMAGLIRNSAMLRDHAIDMVLAFPGGRGTADMVRKAKAACVLVVAAEDVADWLDLDSWAKDQWRDLVTSGQGWG